MLAARRQELGLTQTELADLAGVARGPVVSLEAGRAVTLDVILAVLQVLGLHLETVRGAGSASQPEVSRELADHFGLPSVAEPR